MLKMSTKNKTRLCFEGATMGTHYSAIVLLDDISEQHKIHNKLQCAVDLVDQQMSTWKVNSDLSLFNAAPINQWIDAPKEMIEVMREAQDIYSLSNGAFNPIVLNIINAWGFGPEEPKSLIRHGNEMSDFNLIDVDAQTLKLRKQADVKIDLCGIAKGFGVDQLAAVFEQLGLKNYLVSIDGEMRSLGTSDGQPWQIGIEKPDFRSRDIYLPITLQNESIATSGDYRHWKQIGGKLVSHTIDPHLGRPADNALASVSVISKTCMKADALATALMVMGEDKGIAFAEKHQISALFLMRDPDDFETGLFEYRTGKFCHQ